MRDRVARANGVDDHLRGCVFAEFRVDEHVIQVQVFPIAPEIEADEVGARLVGGANQFLHVVRVREPLTRPRDPLMPGGIDEHVKNVRAVLKHALGSTAHSDAIAPGVRLRNQASAERRHGLPVENVRLVE